MSAPDLTEPIRMALIGSASIMGLLPSYLGAPAVFTKRPVPGDAPYPMVVISDDITNREQDGISDFRPLIVRDIAVYHTNEQASNFRSIDDIAQFIRTLFHRQRSSMTVTDWNVVDVQASVPFFVQFQQDQITGRIVQLSVLMARRDGGS